MLNAWKVIEWEKTRNADAKRYSTMLGVPNPIMSVVAEALGLTETPTPPKSVAVSMEAFGL